MSISSTNDCKISAPYINWVPDVKMSNKAIAFGNRLRDILRKGSSMEELHSYVNYAEGSETLEENYGTEPWRLERLRALKEKYDPSGKFNFYNPIIQ